MKRKMIAFLLLIAFSFAVCGCQGDWRYDLMGGYAITRIDSKCISLVHYEEADGPGSYVSENFFVTDFCRNQRFIGVQGIPTADTFATDEELAQTERCFYLVDTMDGKIYGPYSDQQEWTAQSHAVGTEDLPAWRSTDSLGAYANGE